MQKGYSKHSDEIEQILGHKNYDAVITKDNIVIIKSNRRKRTMKIENLVLLKNFFYKWFCVTFLIYLFSAIIFMVSKGYFVNLAQSLWGINQASYYKIAITFFTSMKFVLIVFILSPALALHWLINSIKRHKVD